MPMVLLRSMWVRSGHGRPVDEQSSHRLHESILASVALGRPGRDCPAQRRGHVCGAVAGGGRGWACAERRGGQVADPLELPVVEDVDDELADVAGMVAP